MGIKNEEPEDLFCISQTDPKKWYIWFMTMKQSKSNQSDLGTARWSWNVIKHKSPMWFLQAEINPSTWKPWGDFFYTSRFS